MATFRFSQAEIGTITWDIPDDLVGTVARQSPELQHETLIRASSHLVTIIVCIKYALENGIFAGDVMETLGHHLSDAVDEINLLLRNKGKKLQ